MDAIVLMGHGSRDQDGAEEFSRLVGAVRRAAPRYLVEGGVLEFPGAMVPSIAEAVDRCAAQGARRVVTVPILLHEAGHNKRDMPAEVRAAQARHPGIAIAAAPGLGQVPGLLEIVEERLQQLEAGRPPRAQTETAILLVGRGSTDPEANADFFRIGRLLSERLGYPLVECCFVSLAGPAVQEGIERCIRLGATRVQVLPYFLSTGLLLKRIAAQAAEAQCGHPDVDIAVGEHLGVHPRLVEIILCRVAEAHERQEATGAPGTNGIPAPVPATPTPSRLVERYVLPPTEIEALSLQRVAAALGDLQELPEPDRSVVQRMVYATGDASLAPLIRLHPTAVAAGVAALRAGRPIVVDVRMVEVALDRGRIAQLGARVRCAVDEPAIARAAAAQELPRAVLAMRALATELDGGIVVIGTAPTALLALLDLVDAGMARPALIIGTPVGFVAAAEAKAELAARAVPFITVEGTRGGAAMAAAAANALLRLAADGPSTRATSGNP